MTRQDEVFLWHDEVRRRLRDWADWSRGHQLIRGTRHVLAAMIQRAAGEVQDSDTSAYDFTFEIQAVDRAVAQMRVLSRALGGRAGRRIKASKYVLMSVYLGHQDIEELAKKLDKSEHYIRARLIEAETFVGQSIPQMEKHLIERAKTDRFGGV